MSVEKILNCKCELNGKSITVKEYLKSLLEKLWLEGDCFSAKRPFGDSGWEYDLYIALVKGGLIDGLIDEHGDVYEIDQDSANKAILKAIESL